MACDTFIKIANKCRRHFVALQPGETEPFIDEIVRTMRKITQDLTPQQVHTFYEACGFMISAQGQKSMQERLIGELMSFPNQAVRPSFPLYCKPISFNYTVGYDHCSGKSRSFEPFRWREDQNHWKHHENQRRRLFIHRKLLLPSDR